MNDIAGLSDRQKEIQVMLIDDNAIDHFLVTKFFQKEGLRKEVMTFESAEAALIYLSNIHDEQVLPDIILVDINMPGMSGFDFLDAFAQLEASIKHHCNIVMLSSSLSPEEIERAKGNPYVKFYLDKPLTREKLELIFRHTNF